MRIPRISIRSMIYLIVFVALDCAWAPNIWKMKSVFGLSWHCLDLPVIGLANVMAVAGYLLVRRWRNRPFLVGFVAAGVIAMPAYVLTLRSFPEWAGKWVNDRLMVVQNQYIQWVPITDNHLNEPGYVWRYVPLDALLALAGTLPMTLIAASVGLVVKLVAVLIQRSRRSGSSPEPGR